MLGYESERRLKSLLMAVCDGEIDLERHRQRMCEIRDFAPFSAFERIDRDGNGFLTSRELLNFLRDNRAYGITEEECHRLLKFFDSDEDGRLSFEDFKQMVLPCEDNYLRNVTLGRYAPRIGRYESLPRDIESMLTGVLEKELAMQRRIEICKKDLEYRYDFSVYAAYRSIDRYNDGFINQYVLGSFLRNMGHYATERELVAIIRRIDTDGDARLSLAEFSDYLRSHNPPSRYEMVEDNIRARSYSEEKRRRNLAASASKYGSPYRYEPATSSPLRPRSADPYSRN